MGQRSQSMFHPSPGNWSPGRTSELNSECIKCGQTRSLLLGWKQRALEKQSELNALHMEQDDFMQALINSLHRIIGIHISREDLQTLGAVEEQKDGSGEQQGGEKL